MNNKNIKEITCPVCSSSNTDVFLKIPEVPVHCNLLWETRDDALRAPMSEIILVFCKNCGHVFNSAFDLDLMKYTQQYENSLHFSAVFQDYARELADRLIDTYDLHGKNIIEIGCGKGEFLKLLCEIGGNRGVGFDPSYENVDNTESDKITFIKDFYSNRYPDHAVDFMCCRQVLEHIQYPRDFLTDLRKMIAGNETIVFFEVPNVDYTLMDLGIWDLIYEHRSFFSKSSLSYLFYSCGFSISNLTESYRGQFLCIEALPDKLLSLPSIPKTEFAVSMKMKSDVKKFTGIFWAAIDEWKEKLKEIEHSCQKVVLWGAGSKGATFLNMIGCRHQIEYVIDINPRKHEKYIPGTGQKIVPPEFLKEYRPDIVIVMNPIYENEIQQTIDHLGLSARMILVHDEIIDIHL